MAIFIKDADILTRQNGTKMLLFRNFSCLDGKYKSAYPNFNVVLTKDCAEKLIDEGFNVVEYPSRDDPDEMMYRLKVNVRFDNFPPKLFKVCGNRKIRLDETTISDLDRDEIVKLDMTVNRSNGGATYINTGYFTIDEDEIDRLYNFDDGEEYV